MSAGQLHHSDRWLESPQHAVELRSELQWVHPAFTVEQFLRLLADDQLMTNT